MKLEESWMSCIGKQKLQPLKYVACLVRPREIQVVQFFGDLLVLQLTKCKIGHLEILL